MQANISALSLVNSSTGLFRFEPLPANNIAVVNGTLGNGTIVDGYIYNGTSFNGTGLKNTSVIELVQATHYATLSLVSLIYLIIVVVVIPATVLCSWGTIKALMQKRLRDEPVVTNTAFTERDLKRRLDRFYPPDPTSTLLPSHLELASHRSGGAGPSPELRLCRELIRAKYALDVEAYSQRDVHVLNRPIVEDKIRRSKGALEDIKRIVVGWHNSRDEWTNEEWVHVEDIFRRIQLLCQPRAGPVEPIGMEELEG